MQQYTTQKHTVRFGWIATLALILCLTALSASALAADLAGRDGTTTASVSFIEGDLEFPGDVGGSGMYFQFGEHVIPISEIAYPAENAAEGGSPVPHVLPVEDSRYASGDWHVTVSLTDFADNATNPTSTFGAFIQLVNPAVANQNTSAGTEGLTVLDDITILSGAQATLVMHADDTLPRGLFTATWTNEQVTLNIGDSEVTKLQPLDYAATLTWTLSLGPI